MIIAMNRLQILRSTHLSPVRKAFCRFMTSANPNMVDASQAPPDFGDSAVVYPNLISAIQADALVNDIKVRLKRRRYEKGHWDAVIVNYKETEFSDESVSETSQHVLESVRSLITRNHGIRGNWLPCHAIDLHKEGKLTAHVDSVRFSGDVVAGLSLLSPSIMRLRPERNEEDTDGSLNSSSQGHVDLFLPPLSLYVLVGPSRYKYMHELLPSGAAFGEEIIHRDQRLSIIFRDAKSD